MAATARAVAALYPHAARAVLFYGSCLREARLDGLMLDFYLLVSTYEEAYGRGWYALANRLLPPNVFPFEHGGLAAKYAVLSETDFARECSAEARDPATFARFAQPARLVWAADEDSREATIASVAQAPVTLLALARPTLAGEDLGDPLAAWRRAFRETYAAELRAESGARPDAIVAADPVRYARIGGAVPRTGMNRNEAEQAWRRYRRAGRRRQLLRLAKASTTFAGGIDYLAWKINRHAGAGIALRPWQRRWPLLGAVSLLPSLLWRGAVR